MPLEGGARGGVLGVIRAISRQHPTVLYADVRSPLMTSLLSGRALVKKLAEACAAMATAVAEKRDAATAGVKKKTATRPGARSKTR